MNILTSRQNPLCTHLRKLAAQSRYRRQRGEYLADGEKLWREAVRWNAPARRVVTLPETKLDLPLGVEQTCVTPELMAYLSPMESPQGILFTVEIQENPQRPEKTGRYLVLDGLQDPGNVGAIWRTADALGADGLLLVNHCADRYNPKTVRATMGACFRLPVWELTVEELAALELPLYAADLGQNSLRVGQVDLSHKTVVIGNEGHGVSREVLALCQGSVHIPMRPRCESLNAAAAASVILWEMGGKGGE